MVSIDEILTMVSIALTTAQVDLCFAGDADRNGHISIDEILSAVRYALGACPQARVDASNTFPLADAPGPRDAWPSPRELT